MKQSERQLEALKYVVFTLGLSTLILFHVLTVF